MAKHKFTDRWIASRKATTNTRTEYCDLLVPGLRLRVSGADVRAFSVVVVRPDGSLRRHTLGRYPRWTVAQARDEAVRLWRDAETGEARSATLSGGSPKLMTEPPAAAPPGASAATSGPTYAEMVDAYVSLHCKPNARSWKNIASALRHRSVAHLSGRPAATITKADIVAVLDGLVAAGTPHAAVTVRKYLGMAYRWAQDRDMVAVNPTDRVRQPAKTVERERVLNDDELAAVYRATFALRDPFGPLFRCLILLGQRRTETASMRWSHVVGNEWHLPRSKSGRPLLVPLPALALETIRSLPRHGEDGFVFSTTQGTSHTSGYSKAKAELDRLSGVRNAHIHDWRRTYRSGLSRLGVPQNIARKLVGHQEGVVDRIYDRFEAMPARFAAAEQWCAHVSRITAE